MKRMITILLAVAVLFALAACGSTTKTATITLPQVVEEPTLTVDETPATVEETAPTEPQSEPTASEAPATDTETTAEAQSAETKSDVLVLYFSWSGNLDKMAHWIADETGGDLVRVTAAEAYPEDYNETANRAKKEQDDGTRPAINVDLTAEQLAEYDTVFFGFPVWWYDLPMPMWTLLESFDFSGKTVIPFFSHEGSSNGANALPRLEELAKGATIQSGNALSIRGGKVAGSESDVRNWVNELR